MHSILRIAIATVFSIWGMILRFKTITNRELWLDEINQIGFTLEPLKPLLLRDHPRKDITSFPGDYFLTYPFVKLFGASKMVAIPHAIVTMLGFYLFYLLCQRYFKTTFGYLVAFILLCFNGLLIWHALEIRPYAVLPTLALACFYFAKDVIGKDDSNDRHSLKKFLVGLLFVITILFHAFGIYIVFFVLLFHIIDHLKEESLLDIIRRNVKFIGTIVAIVLLPWIWFVTGILLMSPQGIDVFEYVPNPLLDFYGFSGAIVGHLVAFRSLYFLLFGMLAALFFPIPRQYVWVIPLFCFFLGWCWDSVVHSFSEGIAGSKR